MYVDIVILYRLQVGVFLDISYEDMKVFDLVTYLILQSKFCQDGYVVSGRK